MDLRKISLQLIPGSVAKQITLRREKDKGNISVPCEILKVFFLSGFVEKKKVPTVAKDLMEQIYLSSKMRH